MSENQIHRTCGVLAGVGEDNSVLLSPRGPWPQLGHWADPTSCLSQSSAWQPCLCLERALNQWLPYSLVSSQGQG